MTDNITSHDRQILKPLADRYAKIACLDIQNDRLERYRKTNDLEPVRPVVLIDEVPWGEIDDEALVNRCSLPEFREIETILRRALYQWDHFQADTVIPPVFRITKRIESTGIGIEVSEDRIESTSGTYAAAHGYHDQLATEADLERITMPRIRYDSDATQRAASAASELFGDSLNVEIVGVTFSYNIWDRIAVYRGVDNLLMDLAVKPELMHRTARKFADIGIATAKQLADLGLLDPDPVLLHCTPAKTTSLPAVAPGNPVGVHNVWGRCAAQIFSAVSPAMHDEFDLVYNEELFGDFGLLYYGCCEPLDTKIDILRARFGNLRKLSITPWANVDNAADKIGRDFVLAGKPNPAFVNSRNFDPEPIAAEIDSYLSACRRNGTVCEFVLKDISTIANRPANLTAWVDTVTGVIDRYY